MPDSVKRVVVSKIDMTRKDPKGNNWKPSASVMLLKAQPGLNSDLFFRHVNKNIRTVNFDSDLTMQSVQVCMTVSKEKIMH